MVLFPEHVVEKGAIFSPCQKYRYSLWRIWDRKLPMLGGLLLNPSKATAEEDDPTVYRMGQRARIMGFGGLMISNAFALRSTDPQVLYGHINPIGAQTDYHITQDMGECDTIICGWGKHGTYMDRDLDVMKLLRDLVKERGCKVVALMVNADGTPSHPLYLSYTIRPFEYTGRKL